MAFDRPIEADRVDDLGLFSSFLRAPVVGTILWLLGGEHAKQAEEEEKQKLERERLEDELLRGLGDNDSGHDRNGSENFCNGKDKKYCQSQVDTEDSGATSFHCERSCELLSDNGNGREATDAAAFVLDSWPQVGMIDSIDEDHDHYHRLSSAICHKNKVEAISRTQATKAFGSRTSTSMDIDRPASQLVDSLVAVMEATNLCSPENESGSQKNTKNHKHWKQSGSSSACSSNSSNSLDVPGTDLALAKDQQTSSNARVSDVSHVSGPPHNSNPENSNCRNKKMSWSDECGNRSLVEYFDESTSSISVDASKQTHATAQRSGRKPSCQSTFSLQKFGDQDQDANKNEVMSEGRISNADGRVIKSVLRRSGSWNPPETTCSETGDCRDRVIGGPPSVHCDLANIPSNLHPTHVKKPLRSLSDPSSESCSLQLLASPVKSKEIFHSQYLDNHHAITSDCNVKTPCTDSPKSQDQFVPSMLQSGYGRPTKGLIIPRGGPGGMEGSSGYHMILGTGTSEASRHQSEYHGYQVTPPEQERIDVKNDEQETTTNAHPNARTDCEPSSTLPTPSNRISPKAQLSSQKNPLFLSHHNSGYISPQWGWYVNVTPPTTEIYSSQTRHETDGSKPASNLTSNVATNLRPSS